MQYLTNDDLNYLSAQNQDKINMVVYGMTALMDETNDRVQQLESQTWFQRMSNTLTGKNKMTVNEIANNRDKINVYLSEAISCLYDQNKINENMILGLGNRLNELYAQQIEIKQMMGAFVTKLNQKIISIDNFHMLTEEINQGVYSSDMPIVSICLIASQLDGRTIHDSRKMGILLRAMEQNGILLDEEVLLSDFLQDLLRVSESDSGIVAMMFENAKEDYVTQLSLEVLCQYFFLPDKVRKMKNKKAVVESVLKSNEIDLGYTISPKEYFEDMFLCLSNAISENSSVTIGETVQCEEITQKGIEALEKKDFESAVKYFTIAAEKGYADAQNRLGMRYLHGQGVKQDSAKAFEWQMRAAQQGHMKAQFNVGQAYEHGDGVDTDLKQAFQWYLKSAKQGSVGGQYYLAECYNYGNGTEEDEEEAFRWYKKAAEQGFAKAQYELAECYYLGIGTTEDDEKAYEYYEKAYEQNYSRAAIGLAKCYYYGCGVEEDEDKAKELLEEAAEQGYERAKELLEEWFNISDEDDFGEDLEKAINDLQETWNDVSAQIEDLLDSLEDENDSNKKERMLNHIQNNAGWFMTASNYKVIPYTELSTNIFNTAKSNFAWDADYDDVVCLISTSIWEDGKCGVLFTTKNVYTKSWGGPFTSSYKNPLSKGYSAEFSNNVNEFNTSRMREMLWDLYTIAQEED